MFYGWKIVAALFVVLTVSSGLGFYNQAVMMEAVVRERGFDVSSASLAVSLFFLASGLLGPPLAHVIERVDIRAIVVVGALLAAVCLAGIGSAESEAALIAWNVGFGAGFCASGLLPATTLVARWFEQRRAFALSIASTGLSVGGIVMTPASAALVGEIGIERATPWLGAVYLLGVAPLAAFILRDSPAAIGLQPDGEGDARPRAAPAATGSFGDVLRSRFFWVLGATYVFVMLAQVGGIAHQYGVVATLADERLAPWIIAVLPAFSIMGRLAGGVVIDRVSTSRFTAVMIALEVVSLALIAVADSVALLVAGLALFGATVGNLLMLQPLLIAEAFGAEHYARLFSISNLMSMLGVASGPWLMGIVLDETGRYGDAYLLAVGAAIVALALFLTAPPSRRSA